MVKVINDVRVGKVVVPITVARRWVGDYTNESNPSADYPYSYPAYDFFDSDRNDPAILTDADLLAPALLNVPPKVRSYYALQRLRPALQDALTNEDLGIPLSQIDDPGRIVAMVKPLYAVLDDSRDKPWGINATTLSKVLHRKRPQSVVLHDRWVRQCYVGKDAPVPASRNRSWSDYMVAITLAIRDDIRSQQAVFESLDEATSSPGQLTHIRLLDVVAWCSKGQTPI